MVDVRCISCGNMFQVSEAVFIKTYKSLGTLLSKAMLKTEKYGWLCDNCEPQFYGEMI